jgi:hypothetical protein
LSQEEQEERLRQQREEAEQRERAEQERLQREREEEEQYRLYASVHNSLYFLAAQAIDIGDGVKGALRDKDGADEVGDRRAACRCSDGSSADNALQTVGGDHVVQQCPYNEQVHVACGAGI